LRNKGASKSGRSGIGAAMANLGKLFAMLNQTYADSGIARASQIIRDSVSIRCHESAKNFRGS